MVKSETWYESQPDQRFWETWRLRVRWMLYFVLIVGLVVALNGLSMMLLIEFIQFIVTGILLLWIISKMRRIILLSWNERSFRKRKFLVRVREYLWSDLKHLRQSGVEAALVLEFSNGESVKIRPFNPLIRYDDYVTFENFAKRMLKENA